MNNYSSLVYDGWDRNVSIVETVSGSATSTKQFLWAHYNRREERDGTGAVTKQFYWYGQTISGTKYFYVKDHPDSVTEMTDNSGTVQAQYVYDPYGRATKIQGSLASDFQYAGYYFHAPSGLNLAVKRAYSSNLARWINRDPIEEEGGLNLYSYIGNNPLMDNDPDGTAMAGIFPGIYKNWWDKWKKLWDDFCNRFKKKPPHDPGDGPEDPGGGKQPTGGGGGGGGGGGNWDPFERRFPPPKKTPKRFVPKKGDPYIRRIDLTREDFEKIFKDSEDNPGFDPHEKPIRPDTPPE